MTRYIQVITTVDDIKVAQQLASAIVELRLAACVQVSSCNSIYRWQGAIERADEYLCVMKSRQDLFPELSRQIKDLHPYDVPEIIAVPIYNGNREYLQWLEQELAPGKEE